MRALALGLLLLIGACAEAQFAAQALKSAAPAETPGRYVIGEPYQRGGAWYYPAEDFGYDETGIATVIRDRPAGTTANGERYDETILLAQHRTLPMPSFVRVTNLDNGRSVVVRINDRGPFDAGRVLGVSPRAAELLAMADQTRVRVQILPDESRQIAAALRSGGAQPVGASDGAPVASPRGTVASVPLAPVTPGGSPAVAPPATARPPSVVGRPVAPPPDPTGQLTQGAAQATRLFVQAGAFSSATNADRLVARLRGFGPTAVSPISINGQRLWRVRVGPVSTVREGDQLLARILASGFPDARLIAD